MRLVLLGPPGAGKGTQAAWLRDHYKVPQLSTGDMLRLAVASGSQIGREAQAVMEAGGLVSDDVINRIVAERIDEPDCRDGFVLDGFPRTLAQAEALNGMLRERAVELDAVLVFGVEVETLVDRISGRFACKACGAGYHDRYKPTAVTGQCDSCGGTEFVRRKDDDPAVVRARMAAYEQQTAPLLPYYAAKGLVHRVDGMRPIDEVRAHIETILADLSR